MPEGEIAFKKRKVARSTRPKQLDESDEEVDSAALDEIVEWQRARKKPTGLSVEELNLVKDASAEPKVKEGKKQKVGGCIDAKTLKKEMEDEDIHQMTSFAVETNKRDEDEPLKKYVEERLAQIKGANRMEEVGDVKLMKTEDVLFELPESIKQMAHKKKTEETLSDQMLSGIPEVDLGIEVKIKNIEATEEAKMKLLRERLNKKERGMPEFVPTNIAVNFVQHNRFNIEDSNLPVRRAQQVAKPIPIPRVVGTDIPSTTVPTRIYQNPEKATDDFHYEKFKRHMRRF